MLSLLNFYLSFCLCHIGNFAMVSDGCTEDRRMFHALVTFALLIFPPQCVQNAELSRTRGHFVSLEIVLTAEL